MFSSFHYSYQNMRRHHKHCYMWCFARFVPFAQFKKREKHPYRSVTFSKVAGFSLQLKVTLLHGFFSRFLNCKNGTKSRNVPPICQSTFFIISFESPIGMTRDLWNALKKFGVNCRELVGSRPISKNKELY